MILSPKTHKEVHAEIDEQKKKLKEEQKKKLKEEKKKERNKAKGCKKK